MCVCVRGEKADLWVTEKKLDSFIKKRGGLVES